MPLTANYPDILPRAFTALGLVLVVCLAIWAEGVWFALFIALACGVMLYELATMLGAPLQKAALIGAAGALALGALSVLSLGTALPFILAVPFLGIALLTANRRLFVAFAVAILIAGIGLIVHLTSFGLLWMLWLVCVVVASDVAGYVFGRLLQGPKLWPRVSPSKTWSGTLAGWIAAGCVGLGFMLWAQVGSEIIGISVALAMMAQMGDIAESAVKRKVGVKDSSSLLPGHGGVFDRFDAMVGAAVLLLLIESVADFPPPGSY